ncbi:MAG TPA: RNA ligase family protein [Solirubrobacter sp.]|nr:RNA ligase family protein [Solirubrobacter sp.]
MKYPRIPHLSASPAVAGDDVVLESGAPGALVGREVVVEEKLDGMNVMVWVQDGAPRVGTRGGADTMDRSGERGRVAAWAATHRDELAAGLGDERVLFAEWLLRRHAVPYDRLPAELVGIDVYDRAADAFLAVDERDALLAAMGVARPPLRFRGRLTSLAQLDALFGESAFSDRRAEGLIVRTVDGRPPRVVKHVDPVWGRVGEAPWDGSNRVAS